MNEQTPFPGIRYAFVALLILFLSILIIQSAFQTKTAANDVLAQATLRKISDVLEKYKKQNDVYPSSVHDLVLEEPPYLLKTYFEGVHHGFKFHYETSHNRYEITATPASPRSGTKTFIITTGGHLKQKGSVFNPKK